LVKLILLLNSIVCERNSWHLIILYILIIELIIYGIFILVYRKSLKHGQIGKVLFILISFNIEKFELEFELDFENFMIFIDRLLPQNKQKRFFSTLFQSGHLVSFIFER